MKKYSILLVAILSVMFLSGCRTAKNVTTPSAEVSTAFNAHDYGKRVMKNVPKAQCMTAKISLEMSGGSKDLSVSGNLRMKRDDVIQLSISFFGMELGRLEFTKDYALIIDRFNKQYVKESYEKVNFLTRANIDFNELQALFWNTVFVPGMQQADVSPEHFSMTPDGDRVQLVLAEAPELNYKFTTHADDARLLETQITSKDARNNTQFECKYDNFTQLEGVPFPSTFTFLLRALRKDYTIKMSLSRINTSDDWEKRTEVSSKYKARSVNEIMRQLISVR